MVRFAYQQRLGIARCIQGAVLASTVLLLGGCDENASAPTDSTMADDGCDWSYRYTLEAPSVQLVLLDDPNSDFASAEYLLCYPTQRLDATVSNAYQPTEPRLNRIDVVSYAYHNLSFAQGDMPLLVTAYFSILALVIVRP